jgi:hypothetical protein
MMRKALLATINQNLSPCVVQQYTNDGDIAYYLDASIINNKEMLDESLSEEEVRNLPCVRDAYASLETMIKSITKEFAKAKSKAAKTVNDGMQREMLVAEVLQELPEHLRLALMAVYGSHLLPTTYANIYTANLAKINKEVSSKLSKSQLQRLRKIAPGIFPK